MKIIIKNTNGQLAVNVQSETPISRSEVWATVSLALASMVAEPLQQNNTLPQLKKAVVDQTAEMLAKAVKDDFIKVATGNCRGVSFYNKEAEFMRKVYDL